jgi:hypothetical protein
MKPLPFWKVGFARAHHSQYSLGDSWGPQGVLADLNPSRVGETRTEIWMFWHQRGRCFNCVVRRPQGRSGTSDGGLLAAAPTLTCGRARLPELCSRVHSRPQNHPGGRKGEASLPGAEKQGAKRYYFEKAKHINGLFGISSPRSWHRGRCR